MTTLDALTTFGGDFLGRIHYRRGTHFEGRRGPFSRRAEMAVVGSTVFRGYPQTTRFVPARSHTDRTWALRTPTKDIVEAFSLIDAPDLKPRYNIAPTRQIAAIKLDPESGTRKLSLLRLGPHSVLG